VGRASKNVWWRAVTPTFSMSFVRMHFWVVVARACARGAWPRKIRLKSSIPAIVSSTVGSSGMSDALGSRAWPRRS